MTAPNAASFADVNAAVCSELEVVLFMATFVAWAEQAVELSSWRLMSELSARWSLR